ncbi:hypothetical protein HXX01_03025 [Candidatus Nomurabacteria bacterium]|nr:hypothetical protein [Candidatus Nomurabacteria bacterium]
MEENKKTERKVIRISRKKLIWGIVVLVLILIAGGYIYIRNSAKTGRYPMYESVGSLDSSFKSTSNSIMPSRPYDDNYRYQNQNPSITDTREFLKTSYNSTLKTRDVSGVTTQVKNTIKAADGRVDNFYSSEKYGRISFVVAKSKFEAFKNEIEGIVHKKLYTESISSENLLGEKQGIEGQLSDANQSLDSLISQRTELTNSHNKTSSSLSKDLDRINGELSKLSDNMLVEKNAQTLISLQNQKTLLNGQYADEKQKLIEENKNYVVTKQNLDQMISGESGSIKNIKKQDGQFTDNIETVNGYIVIEWCSFWEMATIFSPVHPTLVIIILIIVSIIGFRKRLPKVVIEK